MTIRLCAIILLVCCAATAWAIGNAGRSQAPDNATTYWNCFRGPQQGVSPWPNAPLSWDGPSGKGVLWKAPLKMAGVSSPVVWGNRVFITEGNLSERAVLAFDANTGKRLWRQVVPDGGKGKPMPSVSDSGMALPTPACDADGVYALFGTGDLAAFSHEGMPKWTIFLKRPAMGYGYSSSLCVARSLVCVQFDDLADGRVLAVETATGKIKWEQERSRSAAWSSPMIIPGVGGEPLFVVNAPGSLTAFNLAGQMVWDVDGATGEVTPSPAWWNGRIYALNVGSPLFCYQVGENPKELWRYTGAMANTSSPVVARGLLFQVSGTSQLVCIDATTGKKLWSNKAAGCYASLVASGGCIYALARSGTMFIIAAERTYRLIASCPLGEGSDATPAMGDGRLYIRTHSHLWCLGAR